MKERVVFIDRAGFCAEDIPIPAFDHTWSEFPQTSDIDLVPRVFWATTLITHDSPLDAATLEQLHKLQRVIITGQASVDAAVCAARGVAVLHATGVASAELIALLDAAVSAAS